MFENTSKLDYPGLRPQRFHGGRMHLRQVDTLDLNMQTSIAIEKGRKHYSFEPTKVFQYKPGIKVGFPKNITSEELLFRENNCHSSVKMKKLMFVPPQKRIRIGLNSSSHLPQINQSRVQRLTQLQKDKIEQLNEDKRVVLELDVWENQFASMK